MKMGAGRALTPVRFGSSGGGRKEPGTGFESMAEGEGFEPPDALRHLLISSQVPLTTQPPFHDSQRSVQRRGVVSTGSGEMPARRKRNFALNDKPRPIAFFSPTDPNRTSAAASLDLD